MASGRQGNGAIVAIDSARGSGDNRRMIARFAPLVLSLVRADARSRSTCATRRQMRPSTASSRAISRATPQSIQADLEAD